MKWAWLHISKRDSDREKAHLADRNTGLIMYYGKVCVMVKVVMWRADT